ncbi:lantibiotic dehydratase C-terminal domain-containing protein [Streptomyces sp. NBC_01198]|uniref:lantibiotic dehydratase C-terminal domain-containing protein n=1 Tax=Streptomyces sp. NBC_01198 TaxID=2903769 RepID=UPI002E116A93|nr:hypothetical protein OG702_02280 [Streptomyces sp. NBC_01198]
MSWVSLHAFHHGDLDVLLLDGVRPLVDDLRRAALIDGFFYLRYWDGGPHLRVRLRTARDAEVTGIALGALRGYLRDHPAADRPQPGYPAQSARLAAAEGVTDHLRTPEPNNTVRAVAYRPETGRYGEGVSLAAAERHFGESSRIALGLIAAGADRGQRQIAAFAALVLAWQGLPRPPVPPADPATEAGDDEAYRGNVTLLHDVAAAAARIAAGTSPLPDDGALTAWWRTVSSLPEPGVRDICAHLFCNRLGVGPREEHRLRRLAYRTVTCESEDR